MLQFEQVMAPLGSEVFLRDYWLKQFVHVRGTPGRFAELLGWDALNAILEQHRLTPPRLKLYRDGQPVDPSLYLTASRFGVPRLDAGGLALCLAQGASLILDDAQEVAPGVAELMTVFQDALGTDAFANLYAGWHAQNAFNRHWDAQEAVVLQIAGRKKWRVWKPTRLHPLQNDSETPAQPGGAPVWEGVLGDGDLLYIPRGWWHDAVPLNEPSLHVTVSLTPPTALDYLGWVMARLRDTPALRASLPPQGDGAWQTDRAAQIAAAMAEALASAPLQDFQREWEANIRPMPHITLPFSPYEQLAPLDDNSRLRLASLHRLSFTAQGETYEFSAAGRLWTVPKGLQGALGQLRNSREHSLDELGEGLAPSQRGDLLKSLTVLAQAGVVLVRKNA